MQAGLFSGVVTTFVIEFYKLLQQDSSQVTNALLARISAQLDNSSTEALGPDSSTAAFDPGRASRWINGLWFMALLLSLAAAFFAMVAKQWLREYLQWTSLSADPSEVVVLRQLRADAWEKWQVPALIGAIPALLELSLVLFLCGMVILLWTLDSLVAIVLTTFAGIFLTLAFSVTVLPTIRHDCPYKSPVGWACVFLWNKIIQAAPPETDNEKWNVYRYVHLSAKTWVRRDLFHTTGVPRYVKAVNPDIRAQFAARILVPLAQALVWVKKDSESTVVLKRVDHCIRAIHETADKLISHGSTHEQDPGQVMVHRLNAALFTACKLFRLEIGQMREAIRSTYVFSTPQGVGRSGYQLWQECVYRTKNQAQLTDLIRPVIESARTHVGGTDGCGSEEVEIAYRILVSAMGHAVSYMFPQKTDVTGLPVADSWAEHAPSVHGLPQDHRSSGPTATLTVPHTPLRAHRPPPSLISPVVPSPVLQKEERQAFVDIFCLIEVIMSLHHRTEPGDRSATEFMRLTTRIYRLLYASPPIEEQYPGLRTMTFQTLCKLGNPEKVLHGLMTGGMMSSWPFDCIVSGLTNICRWPRARARQSGAHTLRSIRNRRRQVVPRQRRLLAP